MPDRIRSLPVWSWLLPLLCTLVLLVAWGSGASPAAQAVAAGAALATMIVSNGIVRLCLLIGGLRHSSCSHSSHEGMPDTALRLNISRRRGNLSA